VYIAADATDGEAAIVAGNYIGLTARNKGKLRLKPPSGKERDERGERGVRREITEKLREKVSCRPELSKQGAN